MGEDTLYGTAQAIGSGVQSMGKALAEIKPDMLVVYADRFEGFAAVIAGTQMNVPTAHVEGGDLTEGDALDDSVRHAMSKLAHLHFTTNQQASNRVMGMGEEAWRVHTVGFPAIDLIQDNIFAKPEELVEKYKLDLSRPVMVFTQHSVTTEFDKAVEQVRPVLEGLRKLGDEGVQILLTYPNNDAGGMRIIVGISQQNLHAPRCGFPTSMARGNLPRACCHGSLAKFRGPTRSKYGVPPRCGTFAGSQTPRTRFWRQSRLRKPVSSTSERAWVHPWAISRGWRWKPQTNWKGRCSRKLRRAAVPSLSLISPTPRAGLVGRRLRACRQA